MADAIEYQVSIRGRGKVPTREQASADVLRAIDGDETIHDVQIHVWRSGKDLDWRADNKRAAALRSTLRGLLQSGRIKLQIRRS